MHIYRGTQFSTDPPELSHPFHCTSLTFNDHPVEHLWLCFSSVPKYSQKNPSLCHFCAQVQPEEPIAVPKYSQKNAPLYQFCVQVQPEEPIAVSFLRPSTARRTHRCAQVQPEERTAVSVLCPSTARTQRCAQVQPEERTAHFPLSVTNSCFINKVTCTMHNCCISKLPAFLLHTRSLIPDKKGNEEISFPTKGKISQNQVPVP